MKNIVKNFFKGASSVTLYPLATQIPSSTVQNSWNRVWESFAVVNKNLNGIIYGQTKKIIQIF